MTPAGSLRRGRETVGDLDLLLTLADGFTSQKHIDAIAEHILHLSTHRSGSGARVKTKSASTSTTASRWTCASSTKESFGAALLYFTGSKEHNVKLRGRANDMGLHAQRIRPGHAKGRTPGRRAHRRGNLRQAQARLRPAGTSREHRRDRRRRSSTSCRS